MYITTSLPYSFIITNIELNLQESLLLLMNLFGGSEELQYFVLQSASGPFLLECVAQGLLSDVFDMQREAVFALRAACL